MILYTPTGVVQKIGAHSVLIVSAAMTYGVHRRITDLKTHITVVALLHDSKDGTV